MGEVSAKEFINNFNENMKNPLYKQNFEINMKLMLEKHIDIDVREEIHKRFNDLRTQQSSKSPLEVIESNYLRTQKLQEIGFGEFSNVLECL
jgi:hypothetical protein